MKISNSHTFFYSGEGLSKEQQRHNQAASLFYLPLRSCEYVIVDPQKLTQTKISQKVSAIDVLKTIGKIILIATLIIPVIYRFYLLPNIEQQVNNKIIETYKNLNDQEKQDLIFDVITESDTDDFLSNYLKQSQNRDKDALKFLSIAIPDLENQIKALDSNVVFEKLERMAAPLLNSDPHSFYEIFPLLSSTAQLKILTPLLSPVNAEDPMTIAKELLLRTPSCKEALLKRAPDSCPGLLKIADECLKTLNMPLFCNVFNALLPQQQIPYIERLVREDQFYPFHKLICSETDIVLDHPLVWFSEIERKRHAQGVDESFELYKHFRNLSECKQLPPDSIASLYWRAPKCNELTEEEIRFIHNLSFDQVFTLSKLQLIKQHWIKGWCLDVRSNETILDIFRTKIIHEQADYAVMFFLKFLSLEQVEHLIENDYEKTISIFGRRGQPKRSPEIIEYWESKIKEAKLPVSEVQKRIEKLKIQEYGKQIIDSIKTDAFLDKMFKESMIEWSNNFKKVREFVRLAKINPEAAKSYFRPKSAEKQPAPPQVNDKLEKNFETLGLKKGVEYSKGDISQISRQLMRKYHPDKHTKDTPEMQTQCAETFKAIGNARDELLKILETTTSLKL